MATWDPGFGVLCGVAIIVTMGFVLSLHDHAAHSRLARVALDVVAWGFALGAASGLALVVTAVGMALWPA